MNNNGKNERNIVSNTKNNIYDKLWMTHVIELNLDAHLAVNGISSISGCNCPQSIDISIEIYHHFDKIMKIS